MAEGTGLENRHTGEPGIESSNLSLSVPHPAHRILFRGVRMRASLIVGLLIASAMSTAAPALAQAKTKEPAESI